MKRIINDLKYIESTEDVTIDEIVDDFMEGEFFIEDWNDGDYDVNVEDFDYFFENYELTEEESNEVCKKIYEAVEKRVEETKKEEEGLLKDRKSILALIEDLYDDCDEPMFRFLSSEEILDLIIENGRK